MADPYERDAMRGVGEVLLRQKVTSPPWAMALAMIGPVAPLLGMGLWLLAGGQILGGLGALAGAAAAFVAMGFVMVTFASARIAVSEGELHLQLGMAGPRIRIEDIVDVSLAPSGSNRMGMGVRNDLRGTTTYTLWGDNTRAVHVTKADGKKLVIVSKEPDALFTAIEDARARKGAGTVRVRVPGVEAGVDEEERAVSARARAKAGR